MEITAQRLGQRPLDPGDVGPQLAAPGRSAHETDPDARARAEARSQRARSDRRQSPERLADLDGDGRDYRGRLVRLAPFGVVALGAQLSVLITPGPASALEFWISTGLLVLTAVLLGLPLRRLPPWAGTLAAASYVASAALLMGASGDINSGFGALLLIPTMAVALYGRRWQSALVVASVVGALVGVSIANHDTTTILLRRVILWGSMATVISVSTHLLRQRLTRSLDRSTELLYQAVTLSDAAEQLTSSLDPGEVMHKASRLAAEIASPAPIGLRRGGYFRVEGDTVHVEALFDESETDVVTHWALADHPMASQVVISGRPARGELEFEAMGATLRRVLRQAGVTHGAWVPVSLDRRLHGLLAVAGRGTPITEERFERLVALAKIVELAMSNAMAHERLEYRATIDERRRIARELHDGLAHELAFIASRTGASTRRPLTTLDTKELAHAAERALDEARRAITLLSSDQPEPLETSIAQTVEDLAVRHDLVARLDLAPDIDVTPVTAENLLRIVREAVTNTARHSGARGVLVRLWRDQGVHLVVEDDGSGFDPGSASHASYGLVSMQERAAAVGALLTLQSRPMEGTRIEVVVP